MTRLRLKRSRAQRAIPDPAFRQWVSGGIVRSCFYRTGSGYLVRFPDLADFEISIDAQAVACHPAPSVDDDTCAHLYQNQVLPLILSKGGKLVFHASAVEVGACAVAFVGESGMGKSTLAASFVAAGHRFLTDDGLVIEELAGRFHAFPSHPWLRLWSDSMEAVIPDDHAARHAGPAGRKRILEGTGDRYCAQVLPMRGVYFLGDATEDSVQLHRLSASDAMLEWVRNSFMLDPQDPALLAPHFDRLAGLANRQACFRLDYPRRYEELGRVRDALIEHFAGPDP